MEYFIINGGRPIQGQTVIRGSKNAASKMMIASLLTDQVCVLENIPYSGEIEITKELCQSIGSRVLIEKNHQLEIETVKINTPKIPQLSRRNRIPILTLGPLLHRTGSAEIPVLGGCPIGHRPINFHIAALEEMGVKIERLENSYRAQAREIHGAEIVFPFPSVGATENVLLTAVLAKGKTTLANAAVEPEIINLIEMLESMGAKIGHDTKTRTIQIEGVSGLNGTKFQVIPDRNEIVSLACAGLATSGKVLLQIPENIRERYGSKELKRDLEAFLESISEIGADFEIKPDGIQFQGSAPYHSAKIETKSHPGFMTDWQQPFAVLLTQAEGTSSIHETVYEDRFRYTADLNEMGAQISVSAECPVDSRCRFDGKDFKHLATITGPSTLHGEHITMPDIRAGMAHIIAALIAKGESVVSGVEHIDRGYENLDGRLRELGADIRRIQ